VYRSTVYGSGTGQIWLDDLQCTGSETSFVNCTHNGWGVHDCNHYYDVSILCGNGTLHELKCSKVSVSQIERHYTHVSCPYLCQVLTDFQNYFTSTFSRGGALKMQDQKIKDRKMEEQKSLKITRRTRKCGIGK